jgi:hypothetical protein
VTVEEARLQLVQDATDPHSKLVVMRTSARADFSRRDTAPTTAASSNTTSSRGTTGTSAGSSGASSGVREDALSLELISLESFVDHDMSRSGPTKRVTQVLQHCNGTTV